MKYKQQQDLQQSTSVKQAREFITEYIGENLTNLSISNIGRRIYADIYYTDFKPEREVRRHIEDAIPNIYISEIERDFSDEHIADALYNSNLTIYIKEDDGCLRPTTPSNLVYEILQSIDFTAQPSPRPTQEEAEQIAEETERIIEQQQRDGVFSRP